jgi:hypothetical protein
VGKDLLVLGASINLMPLSMLRRIRDLEVKPTRMTLQLADRSLKFPYGVAEGVLVRVDKFVFPVGFVIMDIEEDIVVPLILGRSFMKTVRVIIDVDNGQLKVRVEDDEVNFDLLEAMRHLKDNKSAFRVDVVDKAKLLGKQEMCSASPLEKALMKAHSTLYDLEEDKIEKCLRDLDTLKELPMKTFVPRNLPKEEKSEDKKVELKMFPSHLKYAFLDERGGKPVIISSSLSFVLYA